MDGRVILLVSGFLSAGAFGAGTLLIRSDLRRSSGRSLAERLLPYRVGDVTEHADLFPLEPGGGAHSTE